jgi:transposase
VSISAGDMPVLRWMARDGAPLPEYQIQRARVVLAVADGERIQHVARRMDCDEATVWRTCRRYEQAGLSGLLADGRRSA